MGSAEWVDADGTKSEGHLRNVSSFFFLHIDSLVLFHFASWANLATIENITILPKNET
jgi:hypothetical protein